MGKWHPDELARRDERVEMLAALEQMWEGYSDGLAELRPILSVMDMFFERLLEGETFVPGSPKRFGAQSFAAGIAIALGSAWSDRPYEPMVIKVLTLGVSIIQTDAFGEDDITDLQAEVDKVVNWFQPTMDAVVAARERGVTQDEISAFLLATKPGDLDALAGLGKS